MLANYLSGSVRGWAIDAHRKKNRMEDSARQRQWILVSDQTDWNWRKKHIETQEASESRQHASPSNSDCGKKSLAQWNRTLCVQNIRLYAIPCISICPFMLGDIGYRIKIASPISLYFSRLCQRIWAAGWLVGSSVPYHYLIFFFFLPLICISLCVRLWIFSNEYKYISVICCIQTHSISPALYQSPSVFFVTLSQFATRVTTDNSIAKCSSDWETANENDNIMVSYIFTCKYTSTHLHMIRMIGNSL